MDMLEIKNVAYSYANSKEKVLSGVNQKFELGKFYAIVDFPVPDFPTIA